MKFLDAQNGWICVDFTTYRTTNGGASWFGRHGPLGSSPIYQEEAVVIDASRRLVVTEAEGAEIWQDRGRRAPLDAPLPARCDARLHGHRAASGRRPRRREHGRRSALEQR